METQKPYGKPLIQSKEEALCEAVGIIFDSETALRKALEMYSDDNSLTMKGKWVVRFGEDFLERLSNLIKEHEDVLALLVEMSGIDPFDLNEKGMVEAEHHKDVMENR